MIENRTLFCKFFRIFFMKILLAISPMFFIPFLKLFFNSLVWTGGAQKNLYCIVKIRAAECRAGAKLVLS